MKKFLTLIVGSMLVLSLYSQQGWYTQNSGTGQPLSDVCFVDHNTGWIAGHQNTILKTTDGGQNWEEQMPASVPFFYKVFFLNDQEGWVLGEYETIAHTTDGGDTWELQTTPGHGASDIFFIDADNGWIAGGRGQGFPGPDPIREIQHTEDGGNTWTIQHQVDLEFPLGAIHFADAQTGCAVGSGGDILFTQDGGENWTQQTSTIISQLEGVYMTSPDEGWIVGIDGVILHTTDAGANWMTVNSGTSDALTDVVFVNNKGWICGGSNTDAAILYYDGVSGSWEMQDPGTTDILSAISFVDEMYGWSVGFFGALVHTTTGGLTQTGVTENSMQEGISGFSIYPNPVRSQAGITLFLEKEGLVNLTFYRSNGKCFSTLLNERQNAGSHTWQFDTENLTPGIYYLVLSVNNRLETRKVVKL